MPAPSSRHPDDRRRPRRARPRATTCPPRGVYFAALLSRLTWICCRRAGSPSTQRGSGVDAHRELESRARPSARGPRRPPRRDDDRRSTTRLAQLDLVLRDAARLEQIVEQARHLLRLALEDLDESGRSLSAGARRSVLRSAVAVTIAPSGLRSSCESMARNWSRRRTASWILLLGALLLGDVAEDPDDADDLLRARRAAEAASRGPSVGAAVGPRALLEPVVLGLAGPQRRPRPAGGAPAPRSGRAARTPSCRRRPPDLRAQPRRHRAGWRG